MRVAALDLGSNSFLLLVVEKINNEVQVLHDESVVTRLGQGVQANKRFHEEALKRVEACFKAFSKTILSYKVDKVVAVSTSAARDVENKQDLISLGEKYQIPIQIISGQKEAELTFVGGMFGLDLDDTPLVIDVGGGSTELIAKVQGGEVNGYSLNIGSVRLTEMFITEQPILSSEFENLQKYIREQFSLHQAKLPSAADSAIAVAGTPTTLACVIRGIEFDDTMHGYKLTLKLIKEYQQKFISMSVAERESLPGMQPGRADVIVAGLTILIEALKHYELSEMTVSTKGVRYGLAFEELAKG